MRVPGVTKTAAGNYAPQDPAGNIDNIIGLRAAIILQATKEFRPHLFLVDKEPLGLRGEVGPALELAAANGAHLVLGLRDVLDAPDRLQAEWTRKKSFEALADLYHEIWIFGDDGFYNPLVDLKLPNGVLGKTRFTGYLRRPPGRPLLPTAPPPFSEPFTLVMAGGGGDGGPLINWVLDTYERVPNGLPPSLIVTGPFMPLAEQQAAIARAQPDRRLKIKTFDSQIEILEDDASALVTMGGYNTFSEMLSRDKPCLMVPRTSPRKEQLIRATRAQELGLSHMVVHWADANPQRAEKGAMAQSLKHLIGSPPPSERVWPGMMDGLDQIADLAGPVLNPIEGRIPRQRAL